MVKVNESATQSGEADFSTSASTELVKKKNFAIIPHMHHLSHNLKVGLWGKVDIVVLAPNKLISLCSKTRPYGAIKDVYKKKHRNEYINCRTCVVYVIPLLCGKIYIGQMTGLKEHSNKVSKPSHMVFSQFIVTRADAFLTLKKQLLSGEANSN